MDLSFFCSACDYFAKCIQKRMMSKRPVETNTQERGMCDLDGGLGLNRKQEDDNEREDTFPANMLDFDDHTEKKIDRDYGVLHTFGNHW